MVKEYEPHLTVKQASIADLWHRFTGTPQGDRSGVYLTTKCGEKRYDHWNLRAQYNPRLDRPCAKCFPRGLKPITPNATSTGSTPPGERTDPSSSQSLTSTPEPLVSEATDVGDGGAAREEGSGVLGTGDEGHVEELSTVGESGDSSVAGSTEPQGGQGKSVREPGTQPAQRPTGQRKPQGHSNR